MQEDAGNATAQNFLVSYFNRFVLGEKDVNVPANPSALERGAANGWNADVRSRTCVQKNRKGVARIQNEAHILTVNLAFDAGNPQRRIQRRSKNRAGLKLPLITWPHLPLIKIQRIRGDGVVA